MKLHRSTVVVAAVALAGGAALGADVGATPCEHWIPRDRGIRTMDAVWVGATVKMARFDSAMGGSGYAIADPTVGRHVPQSRP
jgi:hypothetical protein